MIYDSKYEIILFVIQHTAIIFTIYLHYIINKTTIDLLL